jgi:hypothetical protein
LPQIDAGVWFHVPNRGDASKLKWQQPTAGAFNYYHASTQHMIDCIVEDREPIVGVDWGLHLTEMMFDAIESARTGEKYSMTISLDPSSIP